MRPLLRVGIALIGVAIGSLVVHPAAGARSSDESGFFAKVNAERQARGVPTLAWSEELARVARNHSRRMAENDRLYHNPNLGNEVHGWQELGENVGFGNDVEQLHQAFMESNVHRDAILHRGFTRLGIGTVWRDGALWVTEVFDRPMASRASSPARVASAPVPRRTGGRTAGTPVAPAAATAVAVRPPAGPAPVGELTRIMVSRLLAAQDPAPIRAASNPSPPVLRTIPLLMPLGR